MLDCSVLSTVDLLKLRMENGPKLVSLTLVPLAEEHGVQIEFIKRPKSA